MTDRLKSKRITKKPEYFNCKHNVVKRKKEKCASSLTKVEPLRRIVPQEDLLVWGKCKGFGWWPGRIANRFELSGPIDPPDDPTRWIKWFGDGKYTETSIDIIGYFHDFTHFFREGNYLRSQSYREAVDSAIMEASKRSGKKVLSTESGLKWAKKQFLPDGYTKFLPKQLTSEQYKEIRSSKIENTTKEDGLILTKKSKLTSLNRSQNTPDFSEQLKNTLYQVKAKNLQIKDMCLGCGSLEIKCDHPIFLGGLCQPCEVDYQETIYLLDEGGVSCYCCVCSGGKEIIVCDNVNCCKCVCTICLELFKDKESADQELQASPWLCLLCRKENKYGLLLRNENFVENVQRFLNHNFSEINSEVFPVTANAGKPKKPIRVLSLFDGIATGLLALQEVGIDVEVYYASEIDTEAICVAEVRFPTIIKHIGDVTKITDQKLLDLGPIDMVIGGSPCNDLSIVNPARNGIWSDKGSGNLFFEFFRIVRSCQLMACIRDQPFFWLFENVVCMDHSSRQTISHFLQRNPVVLDARIVSPAHRPRCFWGNLPGMSRPMVASLVHKLKLQDCLEPGRTAITEKVRTITTNPNSISKKFISNGKVKLQMFDNTLVIEEKNKNLDSLWITEIERIFGFPDHYTDVRNLPKSGRLRVIGKAWSVPVVKHLFAPLKDFFKCLH